MASSFWTVVSNGAERWVDFTATIGWQAALVAAVVWLIARAARKRPATFRYALWTLVLLRLVLPTDFSSPVGVGTLVGSIREYMRHVGPARYAAGLAPSAIEVAPGGPRRSLLAGKTVPQRCGSTCSFRSRTAR